MAILKQNNPGKAAPRLEPRIAVLSVLMTLAFSLVAVRLYYLQVLKARDFADLADRNRIRIRRVPAPRGLVFDARHRALVDTRSSFDAVIVPDDADDLDKTVTRLESYLGEDHIGEKLAEARDEGQPGFDPITVEERLTWPQVVAVESHQLELPGVSLEVRPRRRYLYGFLAAHLLGYVGEVSLNDLTKLASYHMGDEIGKYGLERGWEKVLRGQAGGQEIEVDAVGRRLRLLKEVPETPGRSVVLTIDLDVQQIAEQAMGSQTGALVAIDPNNGEIIAMVSHPSFDPNVFATGINTAQWRKLVSDPNHPLENRAIQGAYPPGSTFKLVDAIAGLQEHTLTPQTAYYCPGGMWYGNREYRCWRKQGHGDIGLRRAIVESCDVFFYNAGQRLGIDRIAHWAHELGLGLKTGIGLDNEKSGVIPSSAWKRKRFGERWYPAETLSVAIGQGYVSLTPLEMAQLAAQIASGGIRYKPYFVRQIENLDGQVIKKYEPEVEARVPLDPQALEIVRDAMAGVVNAPDGTAHKARLDNVIVCGKTGTAQVVKQAQGVRVTENHQPEKYRDHAWFIAYAPKENPQLAVACIIEHGGHGGSSAAPVVHDVMAKFFEIHPPQTTMPRPALAKVEDVEEAVER